MTRKRILDPQIVIVLRREGKSFSQIGAMFGVTKQAAHDAEKRAGVHTQAEHDEERRERTIRLRDRSALIDRGQITDYQDKVVSIYKQIAAARRRKAEQALNTIVSKLTPALVSAGTWERVLQLQAELAE